MMSIKKLLLFSICLLLNVSMAFGQNSNVVKLWEDEIPNHKETGEVEIQEKGNILWIKNVQEPTLEIFLPTKQSATGKAVIICPGGGYGGLAYDWEGTDIAKWLNAKGIAAFVLKYRLPKPGVVNRKAPLQDAQRAIRVVRKNAEKWNVIKDQIGIMGFSAGGHLAATLATHYENEEYLKKDVVDTLSAKPNFMILIYPVISMKTSLTHQGSRDNLLGDNPKQELIDYYSNELHVTGNTPPTFIVHATDDTAVSVLNSIRFYEALKKQKIYTEMHIYPQGGHGFALAVGKGYLHSWTDQLCDWIQGLK